MLFPIATYCKIATLNNEISLYSNIHHYLTPLPPNCIVSSYDTFFETWWWPSIRTETCSLNNKARSTTLNSAPTPPLPRLIKCASIQYVLWYIALHGGVSVAYAAINWESHKSTDSTLTNAQNTRVKSPDITFNISRNPYDHKMQNYIVVKKTITSDGTYFFPPY
jgi:hypothetical protein